MKLRPSSHLSYFAYLFLLVCAMPVQANDICARPPGTIAGFIESFQGRATEYQLRRNGEEIPVKTGMILYVNDCIQVKVDQHTLRLRMADESFEDLNKGKTTTPYVVKSKGEVPDKTQRIWEWVGSLFPDFSEKTEETVELGIRGNNRVGDPKRPPDFVLPDEPTNWLAAGRRVLHFAWKDGEPPYVFTLYHKGSSKPIYEEANAEQQWIELRQEIKPGVYRARVRSQNQEGESWYAFEAVQKLPPSYRDQGPYLSDEMRKILQAICLSALDEFWSLEAYQRLAEFPDGYRPADEQRQILIHGLPPEQKQSYQLVLQTNCKVN